MVSGDHDNKGGDVASSKPPAWTVRKQLVGGPKEMYM